MPAPVGAAALLPPRQDADKEVTAPVGRAGAKLRPSAAEAPTLPQEALALPAQVRRGEKGTPALIWAGSASTWAPGRWRS